MNEYKKLENSNRESPQFKHPNIKKEAIDQNLSESISKKVWSESEFYQLKELENHYR